MDSLITDSRQLGDALIDFTSGALTNLATDHFPEWRIPGTFAGHRVHADVRADLLFTLTRG